MSPTTRIHALHPERYKWVALSNTTLGALMASINGSIVMIAMPAIFNGIRLDPLQAGNVSYLLWMLMGYLLVTAVLVTTFGRLGDLYGRVRVYNLGFLVFTLAAIALSVDPYVGGAGAVWLILWRLVQAVGGSMIFANSTAIITDAFPAGKRGTAMGINQVAGLAGTFVGLVLGGLMAALHWRWVFLVSVPVGIIGTVWAYLSLRETGERAGLAAGKESLDAIGNLLFAGGLTALLIGITYGIQPYGDRMDGWGNPWVIAGIVGGLAILVAFVWYESRIPNPMVDVRLFRIRVFAFGNLSAFLSAVARGGLQFMLIIWLQGIWLPLHGYAYEDTPLWAGIYMLPLTVGFIIAGPLSGMISDRLGSRIFAPLGLTLVGVTFLGFLMIPVNFPYWLFAVVCFLNGVGSGMFAAPNRSTVMSSVRASERGIASGMSSTFTNAGSSLSIGVFFSLMIAGLAGTLPTALYAGLTTHGVPATVATRIANLPPTGSLFAAFLGYNPIRSMLEPTGVLDKLPAADVGVLTGQQFFPQLISAPFQSGLVIVFLAAAVMSFVGALASLARGKHVRVIGTAAHVEPVAVEVGGERD